LNPLYKWPGGKGREIKLFSQYYPKDFSTYVEPFFGGGAVFFNLEHNSNIINDLNKEVCIFLALIKDGKNKEIFNRISKFRNEEKFYYKVRAWKPVKEIDIAVRFYYLRKTCFRGLSRYNKSGGFNVPFGHYKTFNFDELNNSRYVDILQNTIIKNQSFEELFQDFNSQEYFFFLDPPYDATFDKYTAGGFPKELHELLAKLFKETNSKCLLVIGDTPLIRKLYADYIVEVYDKKYSITTYSKVISPNNHLVIKNFA
jgi:DNA adenine methylase